MHLLLFYRKKTSLWHHYKVLWNIPCNLYWNIDTCFQLPGKVDAYYLENIYCKWVHLTAQFKNTGGQKYRGILILKSSNHWGKDLFIHYIGGARSYGPGGSYNSNHMGGSGANLGQKNYTITFFFHEKKKSNFSRSYSKKINFHFRIISVQRTS